MEQEFKFPTEVIDLPSKGLPYPETSPLSSGKIEMKYMTAKEEDILTNQAFITKGIVIDKLLQSLIVDKSIDYNNLLSADKNALLIAARVLGYGKDYEFDYGGEKQSIDLTTLPDKQIDESLYEKGKNKFKFTLPTSKVDITFKLLTHGDEEKIEQELKGLRKAYKNNPPELSTRLKHIITSVGENEDDNTVRTFVENNLLARDSRALRQYIAEISPDVDLTFYPDNGPEEGVDIPIGIGFLWPDVRL